MGYLVVSLFIFFVLYSKRFGNVLSKTLILLCFFSLHFDLLEVPFIGISFEELFTVLFIMLVFIKYRFMRVPERKLIIGLSLLLAIVVGFFFLIIDPPSTKVVGPTDSWDLVIYGLRSMRNASFSSENSKRLLRMILYIIMILIFANLEKSDEVKNNIVKYVVNFGFVISLIGLLEYVLTYLFGFNVLRGIFSLVFRGNYTERLLIRGNLFSISVLNGEPNGFAIGILPGLMFVANGFYKTRKQIEIILILAYCSAGVFSSSLAGFALSLFGLFIFITNRFISKRSRQKVLMFSLALFLVIIAISSDYYFSRIAGVAGVRDAVGSEGIRTYSIKSAFQWFLERPLFGMGLGTVNCYGAIPALLASTGIIGSILWFLLTFSFDIKNWRKSVLFIIVLLFLSFLGTIGTTYSILPILLSMNFWSERS